MEVGATPPPPLRRVLHRVRDVHLPGSAVRFDYQDLVRHLVAVSDKDDGTETLLDAGTVKVVRTVHLGQEVGNVVYDPTSGALLVAVRPPDELVRVDPSTGEVADRVPLPGCAGAHG